MADYKLGFFGEEIDLKLQQIEELRRGIEQLQQNNATITQAIERIDAAIENILAAGSGAVKSVQKGIVTPPLINGGSWFYDTKVADITLNNINPDKAVVILDGIAYSSSVEGNQPLMPYVYSLTAKTLTIYASGATYGNYANNANKISYQVIEFY